MSLNAMLKSSIQYGGETELRGRIGEKISEAKIYATEKADAGLQVIKDRWTYVGKASKFAYQKMPGQITRTIDQKVEHLSDAMDEQSRDNKESIADEKEEAAWHTLSKIGGRVERKTAGAAYATLKCTSSAADLNMSEISVPNFNGALPDIDPFKLPAMPFKLPEVQNLQLPELSHMPNIRLPKLPNLPKLPDLPELHLQARMPSLPRVGRKALSNVAYKGLEKGIEEGVQRGVDKAQKFVGQPIETQIETIEAKVETVKQNVKEIHEDIAEAVDAVETIIEHRTAPYRERIVASFRRAKSQLVGCLSGCLNVSCVRVVEVCRD